jgi:hypothetical protein
MSAILAVCVQKYPRVAFKRDITPHRIAFFVSSIRLVREAAMPWTIACSGSPEEHSSPTPIRQSPVLLARDQVDSRRSNWVSREMVDQDSRHPVDSLEHC